MPLCVPLAPEWVQKGKTIFISENGHVAYQIKANATYKKHASNSFVITGTLDPWVGSKGHSSFLKVFVERNETQDNMQANSLPLHTPSTPWWGIKVSTFFSSDISQIAYQMNRKVGHAQPKVIYTMSDWREWGYL